MGLFDFSENKVIKKLKRCDTLILTVAFNNPELIEAQIDCIKEKCEDPFIHLIADNSPDKEIRRKIQATVEDRRDDRFVYLSLPLKQSYEPSVSHGNALNYVYERMIQKADEIEYLFTIDHDIFPYKPFSVKQMLGNEKFYGLIQTREDRWYLWPGYSAWKVHEVSLNFLPVPGLDTGGGNYETILNQYDKDSIRSAPERYIDLYDYIIERAAVNEIERTPQNCKIAVIDEKWVHLIDGGNRDKSDLRSYKQEYVMEHILNGDIGS